MPLDYTAGDGVGTDPRFGEVQITFGDTLVKRVLLDRAVDQAVIEPAGGIVEVAHNGEEGAASLQGPATVPDTGSTVWPVKKPPMDGAVALFQPREVFLRGDTPGMTANFIWYQS